MTWDERAVQEIKDLAEGKSTKQRAAVKLGVHVRTIERKLRAYQQEGMSCFVHGNTGKVPANKVDFDSIMKFIEERKLTGCNFTELCRLLQEYGKYRVSSSCLRKQFFLQGILSVKCKRRTRKKLKKFLKELKRREELNQEKVMMLSALEQEEIVGVWHHPTKPRSKYFGERLEMDASSYVWIKGLGTCMLHVCIDDATGFLVGLWLEYEETLHGYYRVMEQVLTKYGVPLQLRTDKRSVFIYNKQGNALPEKDSMTQFAYACSRFGVELGCNSDPDFKPKVERVHQTLQGMLPFRFIMEDITTIEQANAYLQHTFMDYFNGQFGYAVDFVDGKQRAVDSVFVVCSAEEIRTTLAVLCERTVNKGNTIQLDNTYMALVDEAGKRIALPYHTKVTVARLLDGSLYATKGEKCYVLEPVPHRHVFSPEVDQEAERPKPKSVRRPKVPQTHPWSFTKQMEFKRRDTLMKKLEPCYVSPHEGRYA
jgi:transposase